MAYLRPLELQCSNEFCRSASGGRRGKATVEAFNRYNESLGRFCKQCGEKRVKRQTEAEGGRP